MKAQYMVIPVQTSSLSVSQKTPAKTRRSFLMARNLGYVC